MQRIRRKAEIKATFIRRLPVDKCPWLLKATSTGSSLPALPDAQQLVAPVEEESIDNAIRSRTLHIVVGTSFFFFQDPT